MAGAPHNSGILTAEWPFVLAAALFLSLISATAGYLFGNAVGTPLKRAVRDLENLRSSGSGKTQAAEAMAGLQKFSEACRRLSSSLELSSQHNDEALAQAAHALKAPLARQRVQLELLKRRYGDTREIADIGRDIEAMQAMLNKTLDYVRCGAPESSDKEGLHLLDPLPLFAEAIEKNRPLASEKAQRLERDFPAAILPVKADSTALVQVLDELIFNAVRYTPPGGTIRAAASEKDGAVILSVSDDGPGADDDELERIFEPYFRGEAARASGESGEGMGLALALRRCNGMHAVLTAQRRPEGGLRVQIEFPAE